MRERKITGVKKEREDGCLLQLTVEATGHVGVTVLSIAL